MPRDAKGDVAVVDRAREGGNQLQGGLGHLCQSCAGVQAGIVAKDSKQDSSNATPRVQKISK
jgi:hypothetical protein